MKNLKKVLSLALAFAMVLGLCVGAMAAQDVTAAGDWADVTNKDAAQLLNAFNIMQGDDKGNFNPAKNVTRAEAAKMISVALWGGDDLKDWFKDSTTNFTDVHSTDWFAGYVNYAAVYGIVAGRNATTFDPKGNVTGYELLKMTLTALGYKQDTEGLIGANWKVNTMRLAIGGRDQQNLTEDVKVTNWDLPISRDNTAKVIENMVYRTPVTYSLTTGALTPVLEADKETPATFGTYYLGLDTIEGTLVANTYGAMDNTTTTTQDDKYAVSDPTKYNAVVKYTDKDKKDQTISVNSDSSLFELGSKATVYLAGDTVVSTVVTPAAAITSTTAKEDDSPKLTTINIGSGTHYTAPFKFDADEDGKYDIQINVKFEAPIDVNEVVETENFGTVYQTGGVAWRDLYEDDKTLRNGFTAMKTIAGAAPAKGDKIMYAKSVNATSDGKTTVNVGVALETVEGKVARINGTKYTIADTEYTIPATGVTAGIGETAVFYTYPGTTYIVLKGDVKTEASKVALLYDAGYTASTKGTGLGSTGTDSVVEVAAILPDGTTGTYVLAAAPKPDSGYYDLSKDDEIAQVFGSDKPLYGLNSTDWSNTTIKGSKGTEDSNYLVKYTLDENSKMTITEVVTTLKTAQVSDKDTPVTSSTSSLNVTGNTATSKLITSETITFIQSKTNGVESWTVYTGRNASYTITKGKQIDVSVADYNGADKAAIEYAVVKADQITDTNTATSDFYYVIEAKGQIDTKKFEFVVYDASADEVKTITVENTKDIAEGDFFTTYDGKALTIEKTPEWVKAENVGYVKSLNDGILVITGYNAKPEDGKYPFNVVNAYVVASDAKYYVLGDETNSEKITAADVVAQAPASEPTLDTAKNPDELTTPYQAIVITKDGVATTVILFAEEQELVTEVNE